MLDSEGYSLLKIPLGKDIPFLAVELGLRENPLLQRVAVPAEPGKRRSSHHHQLLHCIGTGHQQTVDHTG